MVKTEYSIHQHFYAVHIASHIFGVSYFTNTVMDSSWFIDVPYTLIHFSIFIVTFLYRISCVAPNLSKSDIVSYSVIGIQQIFAIFTIVAIFYQILFNKNQFKQLLQLISLIEQKFITLNHHCSLKNLMVKITCEVMTIVVIISISFIFFVIYYKVRHIGLIMLELFSYINPMLVIMFNLITFINIVWYIRNRFQYLKHILVDLYAIDSFVGNSSNETHKMKLTRKTPNYLQRDIQTISRIYELLFTVSNDLSKIFGYSNLTSMGK